MKTVYDDQHFVRRIHKYKACRLNITLFKRALLSHWSVIEKVTVKIKKIGISNTQKRRKKRGENIEDERAEKINDGGIMGGLCFQDSNDSNDLKTIGIPSTEKKKEAAEENNDGVIKVIDSNSKSIDDERNEAVKELLDGEFNTELIPDESIDAEGNEAVKELLGREFNTELIQNDSEILDKGGGRKKRQFG